MSLPAAGVLLVSVALGAAMSVNAASADPVADFYKGKTIRITVGFGAGGGYDLYARALAEFMGRHIPGKPSMVVENMPGAGSVRATNHIYSVAPKDGTAIGATNQNMPMYQLLGGPGAQFDAAKFNWLGSMAHSNGTLYTWHTSGVKTIEDSKKKEVALGGTGNTSDSHIFPTMMNHLLGTKFKVINGYQGSKDIHIALERGELMGRGGNSWASLTTSNQQWLDEKKINLLVQIGFEKEPEIPDVPLLLDLAKTEKDKQVVTVITLPTAIGYAHFMAPEVPAERVATLRKAYAETMKDPDFLAAGKKRNMLIRPQTGEQIEALVKKAAATPKPVLDETAKILGWTDGNLSLK
jgi:tripartite-type tricarboxylate transporter receptor subunit TctC